MTHHPNPNFKFELFNLVTLDDLGLTQDHQTLKMTLRTIPDTTHADSVVLFQFDVGALPGEASDDR